MPCAWLLTAQESLPPIQFNVPYRCADGTAYVIERCVAGRREEICYFRIEKNGQVEKEVYNVRFAIDRLDEGMPGASWMSYGNHHLVWDLKVDLKQGVNGVVLDQRNAIPLN